MSHQSNTMNINKMTVTLLKQELTQRGLPTDGLKPALIERLQLTMPWMNSNQAFHTLTAKAAATAQVRTEKHAQLERAQAAVERAWAEAERLTAELGQFTVELAAAQSEESAVQRQLMALQPRLFFAPKLPTCVLLSIVGQVGKRTGERAACVKREWRGSVEAAKGLGMYDVKSKLSVLAEGE